MKTQTETHQYEVLFAGSSELTDFYAVYRVANGRTRQVSSWFADVRRANERARMKAEEDGVQWFGR